MIIILSSAWDCDGTVIGKARFHFFSQRSEKVLTGGNLPIKGKFAKLEWRSLEKEFRSLNYDKT